MSKDMKDEQKPKLCVHCQHYYRNDYNKGPRNLCLRDTKPNLIDGGVDHEAAHKCETQRKGSPGNPYFCGEIGQYYKEKTGSNPFRRLP